MNTGKGRFHTLAPYVDVGALNQVHSVDVDTVRVVHGVAGSVGRSVPGQQQCRSQCREVRHEHGIRTHLYEESMP